MPDDPSSEEQPKEQGQDSDAKVQKKDSQDSGNKEKPAGQDKDEGPKKEEEHFHWTPLKIIILVAIVVVALIVGIALYIHSSHHESTDDAYTSGRVHMISSRVNGTVIALDVNDNQWVQQGQVLLQLDPRDYQVKVDQAQANYLRAKQDYDRVQALKGDIAISAQDYDQTRATMETNRAELQDALDQLSYCTIRAPSDGRIGHRDVEVGNRVVIGGALMAVVEQSWIIANFKETQLGKMRRGQVASVHVDAILNHDFTAVVDSFSPGSGSTFALLPPDNATGNFTKIVQRVPVKLYFTRESSDGYGERLIPGVSCEVDVDLQTGPKDQAPPGRPSSQVQ